MKIIEDLERLKEFTYGAMYISSEESILDFLSELVARIDTILASQKKEPNFEQERGISAPVDTNPSRE